MVTLSRIYTKTGDAGDTALGNGRRVPKDHPRVAAYGSVDELNAVLGLTLIAAGERGVADPGAADLVALLQSIQNDLFDVGADLCVPPTDEETPGKVLRVQPSQAERLERSIDLYNTRLQPLRSFVLPGGSALAAWLHLARTVCRRAERDVVALGHDEAINPQVVIYLNRLSDLLFVLARIANEDGKKDVLWAPGQNRAP